METDPNPNLTLTLTLTLIHQQERIKHVEDRVFNDQRYYMDSSKLIKLGWSEEKNWVDVRA
jgi:dTDP-D-glucose 4,6-dehydratase